MLPVVDQSLRPSAAATADLPVLAPPAEIRESATHVEAMPAAETSDPDVLSEDELDGIQDPAVTSRAGEDLTRKIAAEDAAKRRRKGHLAYRYLMNLEMTAGDKKEYFALREWQAAQDEKLAKQRDVVEKQEEVGPLLRNELEE